MIQGNLSAGGQGHGKTVQINVAVVFFEDAFKVVKKNKENNKKEK